MTVFAQGKRNLLILFILVLFENLLAETWEVLQVPLSVMVLPYIIIILLLSLFIVYYLNQRFLSQKSAFQKTEELQELRKIMEAQQNPLLIKNDQLFYQFANSAFYELVSKTRPDGAQAKYLKDEDFWPEEFCQQLFQDDVKALDTLRQSHSHYKLSLNGKDHYLSVSRSPLEVNNRRLLIYNIRDESHQNRMEQRALENELLFRQIAQQSDQAILLSRFDQVVFANQSFLSDMQFDEKRANTLSMDTILNNSAYIHWQKIQERLNENPLDKVEFKIQINNKENHVQQQFSMSASIIELEGLALCLLVGKPLDPGKRVLENTQMPGQFLNQFMDQLENHAIIIYDHRLEILSLRGDILGELPTENGQNICDTLLFIGDPEARKEEFLKALKKPLGKFNFSLLKRTFEVQLFPMVPGKTAAVLLKDISEDLSIHRDLSRQLRKQSESIDRAQLLQRNLNTAKLPNFPNFNLHAMFKPSEELGGDYFNIIRGEFGQIIIILADCMGHGLETSMDATLLKAISDKHMQFLAQTGETSAFLERVNRDLILYPLDGKFPTMLVMVIDPSDGILTYSMANSTLPFIKRNNKVLHLEPVRGFHLGFDERTHYETQHFYLNQGDTLVLGSDSLIETGSVVDFEKNRGRLIELIQKYNEDLDHNARQTYRLLEEINGSPSLPDDLTLILARWMPEMETAFSLTSDTEIVKTEKNIREKLLKYGYSESQINDVLIALHELLLNAFIHGNKNRRGSQVKLSIRLTCESFLFNITDEGEGFDPVQIPDPENREALFQRLDSESETEIAHGRGIWLARYYSDDLQFKANGSEVEVLINKRERPTLFL